MSWKRPSKFRLSELREIGHHHQKVFCWINERLNISDKIISDDDIKNIFKDFKNDEHTFDYKRFLGNLKSFQLNSNDLYGGTQ